MKEWMLFWKLVLIAAAAIFFLVSLVVTVGGFFDVKALFKNIDDQHKETGSNDESS